jgi:two-component system, chemotaxis family, sensor kinase CheA
MEIIFDISEEELPIFLAEADEHLQVLDDVLIRLEQEASDSELVQTVFRSAHTIKGMSGMIGHQRMTNLTHALETVLDGVRKNTVPITKQLINLCLDAVDQLRLLRDEVVTSQTCDLNIDQIVMSLKDFSEGAKKEGLPGKSNIITSKKNIDALPETMTPPIQKKEIQNEVVDVEVGVPCLQSKPYQVQAKINANSIASAARAFQLMMALQDLGDIQSMNPSQAQIETAASVSDFTAVVVADQPFEKISAALTTISDIDEISIDGIVILSKGLSVSDGSEKDKSEQLQYPEKTEDNLSSQPNSSATNNQQTDRRSVSPFGRRASDMTIRANVERLDNLMNLVGELITDRNHLKKIQGSLVHANGNDDQISETITHLGRITDQLQEEVMHIRMLPISSAFGKFPRMVRDMSQKIGKPIDVIIHGEETEMDRSMIEEINDPLIHLVRNSVDHGIESPEQRRAAGKPERGKITLTARHEQGRIILTVEDDGGGINGEKLRNSAIKKGLISAEEASKLTEEQSIDLMFLAGNSTAEKITDISGRGVGLDIVNTNIQRINGSIHVETQLGHGTQFQIVLPLTLAVVPALLVRVRHATFAIPLVMITETLRLEHNEIKHVYQKPVTMLRQSVLSLMSLSDIFNLPQSDEQHRYLFAVVVQSGKQRVGLIVDSLVGEEDVVVKPLGGFIGDIPGVSSAAILSEGQVALIVDVFGLFKLAGI